MDRTLELTSDAPTNAEKHVPSNMHVRVTSDTQNIFSIPIGPNDVVRNDASSFLAFSQTKRHFR